MNSQKILLLFSFFLVSVSIHLTTNTLKNKIFIIAIPKCGTHLLARCVRLLTGGSHKYAAKRRQKELVDFINLMYKNNSSCHAHMTYDACDAEIITTNNIKTLFIFRDPGRVIVFE